MSESRGLTEEETREAGELARRLLELRDRSAPKMKRRQRTGRFDPRSAMRAEHDPDDNRIFRRPAQPTARREGVRIPRVVVEALRQFSLRSAALIRPHEQARVGPNRVREFLWAMHRRGRLRSHVRHGRVYALVTEGRSALALEVPSTEFVLYLDRFTDQIGENPASSPIIAALCELIDEEAHAKIPAESETPAPPAGRPEWDETPLEVAR